MLRAGSIADWLPPLNFALFYNSFLIMNGTWRLPHRGFASTNSMVGVDRSSGIGVPLPSSDAAAWCTLPNMPHAAIATACGSQWESSDCW